jgi:tetratricopeptide (TPR) repeat protein
METRDLLLLIGFLRGGKMYPFAVSSARLPAKRSLRVLYDAIADQEQVLTGGRPSGVSSTRDLDATELEGPLSARDDALRARSAVTDWSGDLLVWTLPIGEVPDPGVLLVLVYDGPAADAALPIDVFAQTLRRYALRDPALRARFDAHVMEHGTFVPPWLSPDVRERRSHEAFDRAMKAAREEGFASAAPLFEGVRGPFYPQAQIALAVHELRELDDAESALGRLDQVVKVAPRNVAARVQRAQILSLDPSRRVEAAADWFAVLKEAAAPSGEPPSPEVTVLATHALFALHAEFANPAKLEAAAAVIQEDPERGFEALSRYVHTHPCAWDGQVLLASLSLARQGFELTARLLRDVRWLYPDDANPHFVYGQALAAKGNVEEALPALELAARLAPNDAAIAHWLEFAQNRSQAASGPASSGVKVAHHVSRTLLLLVGFVRGGRLHPAALPLHRVPGDVALALVVQSLAAQERRRFGAPGDAAAVSPVGTADEEDITLRAVGDRAVLLDSRGERLHIEQLVGDVSDPGVVSALLYGEVAKDPTGRPAYAPPLPDSQRMLAEAVQADTELSSKLKKHLESPDATLMKRLALT